MDRVPVERAAPPPAADAVLTLRLVDVLKPELEEKRGWKLFANRDAADPVLADMDMAGVLLDVPFLKDLSATSTRLRTLERRSKRQRRMGRSTPAARNN